MNGELGYRLREGLGFSLAHFFCMLLCGAMGIAPTNPDPAVDLSTLWSACYSVFWLLCLPFRPDYIQRVAADTHFVMGFFYLGNSLLWGMNFACYRMALLRWKAVRSEQTRGVF